MERIDRSTGTIQKYRRDLRVFLEFLEKRYNGPVYVDEITSADIEAFMTHIKDVLRYSPNSRSHSQYTIRAFFNFVCKRNMAQRNVAQVVDVVKLPKKERMYITQEEGYQLVDAIEIRIVQLIAYFLIHTGLRITECLTLTLTDVDLTTKIIHVRMGKGSKDRVVPINDKLHAKLTDYVENWRDAEDSSFFFATRKTGTISYPYVNATIRNTAKRIGFKMPVTCHVLRHCFASSLVKKNVGIVEIQKLLGHSSLEVTSIYTHADLTQLTDAVNTL